MSNFNQFFKNQGAKTMVERFFTGIDEYTPNKKLTNLTWHLAEEDKRPASYFIENGLTATHKVILEYTINYDDEIRTSEFEVPREIDGVFIIEGAYRIATNNLGKDYDCRINMSGTGRQYINFDYGREYDIKTGILKIKRVNPDLGLPEKVREYKLEEIDELSGIEKEVLKLSERQRKKFQVKLDIDYSPDYISKKLIEDCIAYGDDRIRDLIIDKKIDSVPVGFMKYIFNGGNNKNFYGTKSQLRNYWSKQGKLQDQINVLTNLCARYWKGSSSKKKGEDNDVQVSPGVNAMNLESITNKIYIPETVAYNTTFSDLICVGATPNNGNIGKQNALTVSTHITDEDVLFDCYTTKFQKITIPYLDYLNHKVCASEYVDYDTNTVKPDKDGKVEVKHRMRRKMVPVEEIELIDLHPYYRLSEEVRRIPFVNFTDSVRICMGSGMLKQAIPLVNAERPLVDTGNYEELHTNVLNERFKEESGVVKDVNEEGVLIELPNKDEILIPRKTAIQSINDVDVFTEPKVKKGQKVKKGDVITGAVGLEEDTYKMGINALVLFHAMFGDVNEDALVVSESFSKKMHSYSVIDLIYEVRTNEAIKWIAPIGQQVKSKDPVMMTYKAVKLDLVNKALNDKLGGIFGDQKLDLSEYTIESNLEVPNDIDEAYVSDVRIQENLHPRVPGGTKRPDLTYAHTSEETIKDYNFDRKIIYDRYPEYIAADRLKDISLADKDYKIVYVVRIRLIKRTNLMIGSKVTNRYGGKGVISKILPDDKMPIMVESATGNKKVVDIVMNPYSTINRKIPSVNMESLLGSIAHRIHDIVDERKNDKKKQETIMPLVQKYYPGRFDGMTLEKFLKLHENSKLEDVYYFNVGSYSRLTPKQIDEWAKELGVTPQSKILMPSDTIADLDELKANLSEEEYNTAVKNLTGRYVEVEKPLSVGYMTMEELYQIPTYSDKVTSSMFGVDVNEWVDSPIMGRGGYRKTGQIIGEMELMAYLSRNARDFIKLSRGDTSREDNQLFLNNLLGLGLTVTDSKGYNQGGSSLKSRLGEMKTKFRLKNQK